MSTLKNIHRQAKSRRDGKPAFTLLELIVVLLVLGILAAIAVPTFNRVKENSVQRVAQTTLEAAARNGEGIAKSDGDASDEQIATLVESEFADESGLTVTVSGDTVTVSQTNGAFTAAGSVEFNDGVPTITNATISGGSTTTTVAPTTTTTVATVTYSVGQTGPGGGIVFYVDLAGFACGASLAATCTYLEVAPAASENRVTWAESTYDWTEVSGADGTAVGTGFQNSLDLDALTLNTAAVSAAVYADEYSNNGYNDWYLASKGELNELYLARAAVGNLRNTGLTTLYWSSTEAFTFAAWHQDMANATQGLDARANNLAAWVRPVRAG